MGLQPAAWHDIFVAIATAIAALLGLFFVAISLHPAEFDSHPFRAAGATGAESMELIHTAGAKEAESTAKVVRLLDVGPIAHA